MTLQICLNCRELGMTWYMDDEDRTWWSCSECNFQIEENESKECCCGKCNFALPSVSWLIKNGEGFYWCFHCNRKTDEIKPNSFDNEFLQTVIKNIES